jgi:PAS domain-containing protein
MKRVCAWCGKELSGPQYDSQVNSVTHGICPSCLESVERNHRGSLRDVLGRFEAPVLCIDGGGEIVAANEAACRLLQKDIAEVEGYLCGRFMECRWARLPQGCGKTEHCVGCAIRLAITTTLETGEDTVGQRSYVDRTRPDGTAERTRLLLSTERVNDLVLLRIDEFEDKEPLDPES